MTETPISTARTPLAGAGESLVALLIRTAHAAASILSPPGYSSLDLDEKFIHADESPRMRLQSRRRGRTKTTERHN